MERQSSRDSGERSERRYKRPIDFLKAAKDSKGTFDPGKKVVVIGGGDVAMDCATTAKLLGADVRIYYRRTLEEAPANMTEIQYAISLGITITTNFATKRNHRKRQSGICRIPRQRRNIRSKGCC